MTLHLGNVDAGLTLYIPWHTFDSNGASITLTGLAVTDIEVYKNGSVTQRSSDAGYALLDTDGIDFDGITGIHGISIDLADNTDAGFYSAGAFYWVVISSVTVDTRTLNFVLATFRIGPAAANTTQWNGTAVATPATAGIPDVNVKNIDNDAASASGTVTFPNATLASTTNITAGTIATVTNLTNAPTAGDFTATMKTSLDAATPVVTLAAAAVQAIWDALTSALTTAGSIGKLLTDNINATISSRASPTNITAGTITTVTNLTNAPTAGDLTATMKASVNTEVLDVLTVDTFAQPGQEAPAATQTLKNMFAYLYKGWRNKKTQTATVRELFADNESTVDQKATDSDDGTTYVKGELGSGP